MVNNPHTVVSCLCADIGYTSSDIRGGGPAVGGDDGFTSGTMMNTLLLIYHMSSTLPSHAIRVHKNSPLSVHTLNIKQNQHATTVLSNITHQLLQSFIVCSPGRMNVPFPLEQPAHVSLIYFCIES